MRLTTPNANTFTFIVKLSPALFLKKNLQKHTSEDKIRMQIEHKHLLLSMYQSAQVKKAANDFLMKLKQMQKVIRL